MKIMDTSVGRVILHKWDDYVADGMANSMAELCQRHAAVMVLLLGGGVDPEAISLETVEQMLAGLQQSAGVTLQ